MTLYGNVNDSSFVVFCSYPPLQPACISKRKQALNQKLTAQPSTKTIVPPEGTPV